MAAQLNNAHLRKAREFRERLDAFNIFDDDELLKRYRFNRETIEYIGDLLGDDLVQRSHRNHSLDSTTQLLIALRFYATGKMQICNGDDFGVHQSTVSRVIQRVTSLLSSPAIVRKFIKFPTSADNIRRNQEEFYRLANFPGVVGCVDGTHIRILAPSVNEESYVNRKHFHSINVQIVCDAKCRIIDIVARWPGSTHDSRILNESGLLRMFTTPNIIKADCHLLGDSGYASKAWLLTPFLNPTDGKQTRYNSAHKSTRSIVERTIGQLKRRFHVLHGEVRLCPERVCKTIVACAVLHNIAKQAGLPLPDGDEDDDDNLDGENVNHNAVNNQGEGNRYRQHIVNTYFSCK